MFEKQIAQVKMRSRSSQAHDFWRNRYKPLMDAIRKKAVSIPMSVGMVVPRIGGASRLVIHEIVSDFENMNMKTELWVGASGDSTPPDADALEQIEQFSQRSDIIFLVLFQTTFELPLLTEISKRAAAKLFVYYNRKVETDFQQHSPEFRFKEIFRQSMPMDYPADMKNRRFYDQFMNIGDALRRAKYIQSGFSEQQKPLKSRRNLFSFYLSYKCQIDTFQSSGHTYLLSYIRYLGRASRELLHQHLELPMEQIDDLIAYFKDHRFLEPAPGKSEPSEDSGDSSDTENSGDSEETGETGKSEESAGSGGADRSNGSDEWVRLSYRGDKFFQLLGIASLPILDDEQRRFMERWQWALERTYHTNFELFEKSGRLKALASRMYFSLARTPKIFRQIRYFINRFICDWMKEEENAFLAFPWTQKMFEIWRENIGGVKQIWRTEQRDRIAFLEYMFDKFTIAYHPSQRERFDTFKNRAFHLTMLRPNTHAHIYIIFSFEFRPIKKMIQEYIDLAAITGQYDLLFRRYHPNYMMLKLHAKPGERTAFDMRHFLDWKPLTLRMDTRFTVPIGIDRVRTRQRDRFITIPVIRDPEAEQEKRAEIEAMEKIKPKISYNLLTNNEWADDGQIYFGEGTARAPVEDFMGKRQKFIQINDELNLIKAILRPSNGSGLVVRFNLLDPIAVLINGINRKRDLDLDEMRYLARCLDRLKTAKPADLPGIVDDIFHNPDDASYSEETQDLLNNLERIEKTEQSEEQAWDYLKSRFIHGHYHPVLQAICHRLMNDGFEVLFSLLPLLTGKELVFDEAGIPRVREPGEEKKNQVLLIEILKQELSDLLKSVFSRCIDISAATKRTQSEARLARLIVEHCINVKSDPGAFQQAVADHLTEHYKIHLSFLREHIGESDLFQHIHRVGSNPREVIAADTNEIVRLADRYRKRLFSRENTNRLLCFIDPKSVEVQIGEFQYEGEVIESELAYIMEAEKRERALAEQKKGYDADVRQRELEKNRTIETQEHEKEEEERSLKIKKIRRELNFQDEQDEKRAEEAKEKQLTVSYERIYAYKSKQMEWQTRFHALQALRDGNLPAFAVHSLLEAHQRDGISGVEQFLAQSPNLLLAIAPEVSEVRHLHKLKEELLVNLDKVLNKLDPITLSTLFSKDHDEIIRSDIYKNIMDVLAETLKQFGFRRRARVEQVFSGAGFQQERGGNGGGAGSTSSGETEP